MDIKQIRRANAQYLINTRFSGVRRQFGLKTSISPKIVSRFFSNNPDNSRAIGDNIARRIETSLGLPYGYMDHRIDTFGKNIATKSLQSLGFLIGPPVLTFEQIADHENVIPAMAGDEDVERAPLSPRVAQKFSPLSFAVYMNDNSMISATDHKHSIPNGALVWIASPAPEKIEPGKIVAVKMNSEKKAIIRKYKDRGQDQHGNPVFELVPLNDDYQSVTVNAENPGKIIGLIKLQQVSI